MENLLEVKKVKKKGVKESDLKKMFDELVKNDTEEEKVISELFYNSAKMVLDTGFELAKELNEQLLAETLKNDTKDE